MNKTDFETTLRGSFGIHLLSPLLPLLLLPLYSDRTWTFRGQSFAEITQSDAVQLVWLPGSGPKKSAKLNHIFDQPFHMGMAGDALPTATVSSASASTSVTTTTSVPDVAGRHSSSRGGSTSEDDSGGASGQMGMDTI